MSFTVRPLRPWLDPRRGDEESAGPYRQGNSDPLLSDYFQTRKRISDQIHVHFCVRPQFAETSVASPSLWDVTLRASWTSAPDGSKPTANPQAMSSVAAGAVIYAMKME
jgi:hypothetical protein